MFDSKRLSVLAYADHFTLWKYTTKDTGAEVLAANYFNEVARMVRDCDIIITATDVGSPSPQAGMLVVSASPDSHNVSVSNVGGIK